MHWQKKWSEEDKDQALKDEILAIRREHKDYGYHRIRLDLKLRPRGEQKESSTPAPTAVPSTPIADGATK